MRLVRPSQMMRFSRTQLVGALALLVVIWLVILFRLLFPPL
jgi:hypothetical protein